MPENNSAIIKSLWDQLFDMECMHCTHAAKDHTAGKGPCSECWRQCQTICEHFRPQNPDGAKEILDKLEKEMA